MAIFRRASAHALALAGVLLAGCTMEAADGVFTTGSLTSQANADPACITLASRIEELRKAGIPDKIEKAAAKRYRLTKSDLRKADELNKAHAELQARCSTVPGTTTTTTAAAESATKGAEKQVAKARAKKSAKTGASARAKTN